MNQGGSYSAQFGFTAIPSSYINLSNSGGNSGAAVYGCWIGSIGPTGGTGAVGNATGGILGQVAVVVDGVQGPGTPFYIMGTSGWTGPVCVSAQNLIGGVAAGSHTLYAVIKKDAGDKQMYIYTSNMVGFSLG
jgi:hypothetical protein